MTFRKGLFAAAVFGLIAAAPMQAQDTVEKKPGGLNKVARNVSKTFKKAGRDTKAEIHRDASKAHNALTDAGNGTKKALGKATGIKAPQKESPGGLNKIARNISKTSKKAASDVKSEKNRVKGNLHGASTEAGKSLKDTTLKGKP